MTTTSSTEPATERQLAYIADLRAGAARIASPDFDNTASEDAARANATIAAAQGRKRAHIDGFGEASTPSAATLAAMEVYAASPLRQGDEGFAEVRAAAVAAAEEAAVQRVRERRQRGLDAYAASANTDGLTKAEASELIDALKGL